MSDEGWEGASWDRVAEVSQCKACCVNGGFSSQSSCAEAKLDQFRQFFTIDHHCRFQGLFGVVPIFSRGRIQDPFYEYPQVSHPCSSPV